MLIRKDEFIREVPKCVFLKMTKKQVIDMYRKYFGFSVTYSGKRRMFILRKITIIH